MYARIWVLEELFPFNGEKEIKRARRIECPGAARKFFFPLNIIQVYKTSSRKVEPIPEGGRRHGGYGPPRNAFLR